MARSFRSVSTPVLILGSILTLCSPVRAQLVDTMCDPSFQDCRTPLLNYVRRETSSIDQIVLSPGTYLTKPPGPTKNDTTIVPK